jgi:hypothetical protein
MSPATPPRIQNATWTQEFPADEQAQEAAVSLVAAIGAWSDTLAAKLFASSVDLVRTKKILARLAIEHGTCSIEQGGLRIEHGPFGSERKLQYSLRCSDAPLDLAFDYDDKIGKVTAFSVHAPRSFDAVCWE